MSRDSIFREVSQERDAQDALWGGPVHDDRNMPEDWMWILIRHFGLEADNARELTPERWRRQLVRVCAVAVAAIESHDRLTGREVTAGEFQRGSGV